MRYLLTALIAIFITGCATTERYQLPAETDISDQATLYIYRTDTLFHSLNPERPYIYLNDKVIAKLGTGQSEIVKIPKGEHRLSVRQPLLFMPSYESDAFEYTFEAGKDYYIRYSMEFGEVIPTGTSVAVTGTSKFSITTKENYEARR